MSPPLPPLFIADLAPAGSGEVCARPLRLWATDGRVEVIATVVDLRAAEACPERLAPLLGKVGAIRLPPDAPALTRWLADRGVGARALTEDWRLLPKGPDLARLLTAGVTLVEGPDPALLPGPGVLDAAGRSADELLRQVDAFEEQARVTGRLEGPLSVRLRGALLGDTARLRALLGGLEARSDRVRLGEVRWTGPVHVTPLAEALLVLLRLHLAGHDPVLHLEVPAAPPADAWVAAAAPLVHGRPVTSATVAAVRRAWADRGDGPAAPEGARLLRLLDDAGRFAAMRVVGPLAPGRRAAVPRAVALLDAEAQAVAAERASDAARPTLFVIPTWQCELRCTYCTIPKQDGREMTPSTAERAVELLLSSHADEARVHFFGGEPFAVWPVLKHAIAYGARRAEEIGRRLSWRITTNAYSVTPEQLDWLAEYPVLFQVSIDGDPTTQAVQRPARDPAGDSYRGPGAQARAFLERGFDLDAIMVVSEATVDRLVANFFHIADLGYPRIQINHVLGRLWSDAGRDAFARNLLRLGLELRRRWAEGSTAVQVVNLGENLKEVRTNEHVTVDWDGTIYGSTSFLVTPALAAGNRLGHLDDALSFERLSLGAFPVEHVARHSFREKVLENNSEVGRGMTAFVRWMRDQGWTGPEAFVASPPEPGNVRPRRPPTR